MAPQEIHIRITSFYLHIPQNLKILFKPPVVVVVTAICCRHFYRRGPTGLVYKIATGTPGELKIPIVHVTHSMAEARQLADQIVRIDKGKIVSRGRPDEVLKDVTSIEE